MAELILALDLPNRSGALRLLDRLPGLRWVKVGSVLMTAEGPPLVGELVGRGLSVFLDLKWHDIPNTVAGAVQAAVGLGVRMATVHAAGGPAMMRAAARAGGDSLSVVAVTVLTSIAGRTADAVSSANSVAKAVLQLARSAVSAGLAGVVCSPLEVERVRAAIGPEPLIVSPGIRRPQDRPDDQARVAGPAEAVRAGATHLVVGRPILAAADPAATFNDFLAAIS